MPFRRRSRSAGPASSGPAVSPPPGRDQLDDPTWLRMAYVFTLNREPDPAAWDLYLDEFAEGRLQRDVVLDTMRHSVEYRFQVRPLDLGRSLAHSEAGWVRSLPPAATVLDLRPEGEPDRTMAAAGWPHQAEITVRPQVPDRGAFDLVVLRHLLDPEPGDVQRAASLVRPGGWMAVLVPNRAVTELPPIDEPLPVRGGMTAGELDAALATAGLQVRTRHGLNLASASLDRGSAHAREIAWMVGVYGLPEHCLVLGFTARAR